MATAMSPEGCTHDTANLIEDHQLIEPSKENAPTHNSRKLLFGVTVEPVLILAMFGSNMSGILMTNLLLVRSCEYMNLPNCSSMDKESGGPNEKIVQQYVAQLSMYKLIFESLAPAVMAFFIGPWSDIYGRRPLMLAPLLGYCCNFILLIVFTWFKWPPMFILLTSTPLVLLGGSMTFYTGSFCYINDIVSKQDLPFRMAFADGMLFTGFLFGNTAAPYIYSQFTSHGYEAVFGISLVLCLSALLYVIFLLPESIIGANEYGWRVYMKALFDYTLVVNMFRVCFGHYEGHSRPIRLTLVVVSLLSLLSLEGTIAVSFLFIRNKFSWDVKQFAFYTDAALVIDICGLLFGTVVFSKWCKFPSEPLSCFAYFLKSIGYVTSGLGNQGWCLYLGSAIGCFGGMTGPLNRAIISDTVPKNDIGKLFSILSAFMTAVPIVAGLTYISLYNSTLDTFPGAVYLLSAGLSAICCVLLGVVAILRQFHNPHAYRPSNENESQDQDLFISGSGQLTT